MYLAAQLMTSQLTRDGLDILAIIAGRWPDEAVDNSILVPLIADGRRLPTALMEDLWLDTRVRNEQHLYLRQPGYGTSYLSGKIQIEELLAEEAIQLGDAFRLGGFFDDFFDAGVIPVTLTRWEMTGTRDAILDGPVGY